MLRDWLNCVHQYGALYLGAYPFDLVRIRRAERAEGFDSHCDTDTGTVAYPWNLPSIRHAVTSEIHAYHAAPAWLVREALNSIPLLPDRFVFVDIGSGKGRVLLVASELPFVEIVGVELSRELHQIAQDNINRYQSPTQRCTRFTLHCMNAVDYAFGPAPLVLFLANPFGQASIARVIARLAVSLNATPREVYVIYVNPWFEALFQSKRVLRRVGRGGTWWRPWNRYVIYASTRSWAPTSTDGARRAAGDARGLWYGR
jgi:SAM-dependent methyltransferase